MRAPTVALCVHGRFFAFDLARELQAAGCQVVLLTSYPRFAVRRFDVGTPQLVTCPGREVIRRAIERAPAPVNRGRLAESWHRGFSRWCARTLRRFQPDVVFCFSGVAKELFAALDGEVPRVLIRGSAHIARQRALLARHSERLGVRIELPRRWMIAREQEEYELADHIVVLSEFARRSFLENGLASAKVQRLLPYVDRAFAAAPSTSPLSGQGIYVGQFCLAKGAADLALAAETVSGRRQIHIAGTVSPDARPWYERARQAGAIFHGHVSEADLRDLYARSDYFVFPSLHDGFGVVLLQAALAGLPIVATENCGAPDLAVLGFPTSLVPAGDPAALAQALLDAPARLSADAHQTAVEKLISAQCEDLRQILGSALAC